MCTFNTFEKNEMKYSVLFKPVDSFNRCFYPKRQTVRSENVRKLREERVELLAYVKNGSRWNADIWDSFDLESNTLAPIPKHPSLAIVRPSSIVDHTLVWGSCCHFLHPKMREQRAQFK